MRYLMIASALNWSGRFRTAIARGKRSVRASRNVLALWHCPWRKSVGVRFLAWKTEHPRSKAVSVTRYRELLSGLWLGELDRFPIAGCHRRQSDRIPSLRFFGRHKTNF